MAVVLHLVSPNGDHEKNLDWSLASSDYLKHRNGYPDSFFRLLREIGIGLPGQRILDMGVGTGALAIPFARQGAQVIGVDIAEGQIEACRSRAQELDLYVDLRVARAEATGLPSASIDIVAASMVWAALDKDSAASEVSRLLAPGGKLLISSVNWVAIPGSLSARTKALMGRYNPAMRRMVDEKIDIEMLPPEVRSAFRLQTYHYYLSTMNFSKESWRGCVRASKWISPALPLDVVQAFDSEHAELLASETEPLQIEYLVRLSIFTRI